MKKDQHIFMMISSMMMMLLMGTVYAYSVFRLEIESTYNVGSLLSGIPYMTSLFFYACSMMVSGRLLNTRTLRKMVVIGTILIASGWFISGFAQSFVLLVLSYGVLLGTGVGMVYGVPIFIVQMLFPKRSGYMAGIILLGFGMSPLLTAPLANYLISTLSLHTTFLIFGLMTIFIQLPLSFVFIVKEYPDFKKVSVESPEHLHLKPFKRIYALFVIATTIGLMMIGLSYQIGVIHYDFQVREVTLSISLFALGNGASRPLFGKIMDKKEFHHAVRLSLVLMAFAAILGLINQGEHLILYIFSFGLFWFNLGAWLSIVPATIKEFYGINHYAKKYGVMFTAYGVGSILGTLFSGTIMDFLGWTMYLYVLILVLIIISFIILSKTKMNQQIDETNK